MKSPLLPTLVLSLFVPAVHLFASTTPPPDWPEPAMTLPTAEVLKRAAMVPPQEGGAVVLFDGAEYSLDGKGRSSGIRHRIYRIESAAAIDGWSTSEAEWSPWYQERPTIRVRVISPDGTEHPLDPKNIDESPADDDWYTYSDRRVLRAPLPAVAVGSIIEEEIGESDKEPFYEAGSVHQFGIGEFVPVERIRISISVPHGVPFHIVTRGAGIAKPVATKSESDGDKMLYHFEMTEVPAIDHFEPNLPFDLPQRPYIGFATGKSWKEIARGYAEIVDQQIGKPAAPSAHLSDAQEEKIERDLLSAVQHDVRYTAIEYGRSSIVPTPPAETLARKYGDCKDKATLLVSRLRDAGIPADVVLLKAGADLDVDSDLPGMGDFNHAIVRAGSSHPVWIDPTDEFSSVGDLPIEDQGRLTLVANRASDSLTLTPLSESTKNRSIEIRTFTMSEKGKANVTEETKGTGWLDRDLRRYRAEADPKKYHEAMEQYARNVYLVDSVQRLDTTDPRDLSKPYVLTIEAKDAGRGVTDRGEAAIGVLPAGLLEQMPPALVEDQGEEAKKAHPRIHDFVNYQPYVAEWEYHVIPPVGYAARTLPEKQTESFGTTTLRSEYDLESDGSVKLHFTFDSGKRRLTPAEMQETRKALVAFEKRDAIIIGFDQIGKKRLAEGDVKGALAEYRHLVEIHPKEALHHIDLSLALLEGGLGEAAREEAKKAAALEPSSSPAQQNVGWVLEHDLVGRRFGKGWDPTGALAAYRKAKELDPKNYIARADLAILLEHDASGRRYSKGSKLSEAITEYQALASEVDDHRFDENLMFALFYAERFADLKTLTEKSPATDKGRALHLAAFAASEGVPAALREAAKLDPASRRAAIASAGDFLTYLRHYPEAAAFLDEAAKGSENASQIRARADLIRKTQRHETLVLGDDPKSVATRLVVSFVIGPSDPSQFKTDFDPEVIPPGSQTEEMRGFEQISATFRRRSGDDSVPSDVMADLVLSTIEWTTDGDPATGFRLRSRVSGSASGHDEAFYFSDRGGKARIVAVSSSPAMIGRYVSILAKKGDLEKARKWLDWAREDIHAGGGDDPLAGPIFPHFWNQGDAAAADRIRAAAAVLMIGPFDDWTKESRDTLIQLRGALPADQQPAVDHALAGAAALLHDWTALLPLSAQLMDRYPDSALAFSFRHEALAESGKAAEATALANQRLAKYPHDRDALRSLVRAAQKTGDYASAEKYDEQLLDGEPDAEDYNDIAWNALYFNADLKKAVERARRAVDMTSSHNFATMNTLAAVYAAAGSASEAHDTFFRSLDLSPDEEPQDPDWFVVGRIAEVYGEKDAAIHLYQKIHKPLTPEDVDVSVYHLAEERLATLGVGVSKASK